MRHAFDTDEVAVSEATLGGLADVLSRPRLARFIDPELRDDVLSLLDAYGVVFAPTERVTDCRDPKDNKYLELALAAGAATIVSSDNDLLTLHPWRNVQSLLPTAYVVRALRSISDG